MHKSATKCNETIGKWCKNKHGASKIIDTFETYQPYCVKITKYMEKKIQKGRGHTVVATGNEELRFEVHLKTDKFVTGNIMRTAVSNL
jgi:hypothetical protein